MPASSKSQQKAAGMALAAKRGELEVSELQGAAKEMYDSMSEKELKDYAETERKGLPDKVKNENKSTIKLKDLIKENRGIVHPAVIGKPVNSNTSINEQDALSPYEDELKSLFQEMIRKIQAGEGIDDSSYANNSDGELFAMILSPIIQSTVVRNLDDVRGFWSIMKGKG